MTIADALKCHLNNISVGILIITFISSSKIEINLIIVDTSEYYKMMHVILLYVKHYVDRRSFQLPTVAATLCILSHYLKWLWTNPCILPLVPAIPWLFNVQYKSTFVLIKILYSIVHVFILIFLLVYLASHTSTRNSDQMLASVKKNYLLSP